MVSYNRALLEHEILSFCRFPIPRTPVQLTSHLKSAVPGFYPKTPAWRVVSFLRPSLRILEERGLLLRYTPKSPAWKRVRYMVSYHYRHSPGAPAPRKLVELYQINFLYLADEPSIQRLPVFHEINIDLVAMFYNFTTLPNVRFQTWELINLFWCCSTPQMRDKIRIRLYQLNFSERERNILERALDYWPEFTDTFKSLPFSPNPNRAILFLEQI